jgi:1-(5-phosphoribosyl)-5-[(5-phosphoribosylamino)methylideneamino] imidazole-4-carboxamide isomerase (EC 5.3.1.16)
MLQGTSIELYQQIVQEIPGIYLIASGGVGSMHDLEQLREHNIPAVIIGKALYEGRIMLKELKPFFNLICNRLCYQNASYPASTSKTA